MKLFLKPIRSSLTIVAYLTIFLFLSGCEPRELEAATPAQHSTPQPYPTIQYFDPPTPQLSELPTIDQLRERWLHGSNCVPPCWEDIVPGITTAREALAILESNEIIANVANFHIADNGYIDFDILFLDEDNIIRDRSGLIVYKHPSLDEPIYGIEVGFPPTPLGILIQSYGAPSHAISFFDDQTTSGTWEIRIIWEAFGVQMSTLGQGEYPRVDETLVMNIVAYFQSGLDGYTRYHHNYDDTLCSWQGYSDISTYRYFETYLFPEEATAAATPYQP